VHALSPLFGIRPVLKDSRIGDLTEFGRVVHAEMEALLSCARNNCSCRGATLYGTTFPCHNCAKHIIAAGITRVVFVEPYPKSKAVEFHSDSLVLGFSEQERAVRFEPFVGVGPRRFFDLFSMGLSSGYPVVRKEKRTGNVIEWKPENARLRLQLMPLSYLQLETLAGSLFDDFLLQREGTDGQR
jgi:deoxycytidylate deaminase